MHFLLIHAGYQGSDTAGKIHNPLQRFIYVSFCNDRYLQKPHKSLKKYCFIYVFSDTCNKLITCN